MSSKINITVLCGGQSTEHEISLLSARNISSAFNPNEFKVTVIYIDQQGCWFLIDHLEQFIQSEGIPQTTAHQAIVLDPNQAGQPWLAVASGKRYPCDCVFPALHGALGEDGCAQGLLAMLNLPFVGSHVLGSAICMNKEQSKILLHQAGIPVVDYLAVSEADLLDNTLYQRACAALGNTLFVKPVSLGSSIGTSVVHQQAEFIPALQHALKYDQRALIERKINGREIECAVLGNEQISSSLPGEITTNNEFYSYSAKYLDPKGSKTIEQADLSQDTTAQIQAYAEQAFKLLSCEGMARVDFFLTDTQQIYLNEVNSIPGFTNISMYPKMWEASGLKYQELLKKLIALALKRHSKQQALTHSYQANLNHDCAIHPSQSS